MLVKSIFFGKLRHFTYRKRDKRSFISRGTGQGSLLVLLFTYTEGNVFLKLILLDWRCSYITRVKTWQDIFCCIWFWNLRDDLASFLRVIYTEEGSVFLKLIFFDCRCSKITREKHDKSAFVLHLIGHCYLLFTCRWYRKKCGLKGELPRMTMLWQENCFHTLLNKDTFALRVMNIEERQYILKVDLLNWTLL